MYGSLEGSVMANKANTLRECVRFVRQRDPREMFALFALCA